MLPRWHGNLRWLPKHAFTFEETKTVINFIHNYTEENGIHLSG